jgi:serine/threonine protein kinase
MGTVYLARHRLMGRLVALKVVRQDLLSRPATVERFRREVRAAACLAHPNIVAAYDADQAGGTHFLVLEYVPGVNLEQLLRERGPLPTALACDYARQAALGLQHACEHGMVHRDIKPHNLMVTPHGQVKILDFGLARFVSETAAPGGGGPAPARDAAAGEGLTSDHRGMGTADYAAPEEVRGARQADIRADLYSLGCTLYHLLSGQVPFPAATAHEKLRGHAERAPTPLTELRPDVPAPLARVVERMTAKDPAGRYQTPAEVARALAPFTGVARPLVLVVDDDPSVREALRMALEGEGYPVRCAANGLEGLQQLRAAPLPGLILLDLMMPVMDGWQFLHERQRDPRLAAVPVVVISAASTSLAQALALGAADCLQKPVGLDELTAKVRDRAG